MRDSTEFKNEQIVRNRIAGSSVTKTAELFGISRATILKTITKFKKNWKNFQQPEQFRLRLPDLLTETGVR